MAKCAICEKETMRVRDFKVEGQIFKVCSKCIKEQNGSRNVEAKVREIHFGIPRPKEEETTSPQKNELEPLIPMVTTPTIQGKEIREYHGIVAAQAVEGINVFIDFLGSLRNLSGGRSETLQAVMKNLRRFAMLDLQQEVEKVGGNAVVGLSMDFDEYAEGMMMLSIYGTAVTI